MCVCHLGKAKCVHNYLKRVYVYYNTLHKDKSVYSFLVGVCAYILGKGACVYIFHVCLCVYNLSKGTCVYSFSICLCVDRI